MAQQSESIGRQTASYRRGLVLGLTMAETMLLLVFCLLLATGVVLSNVEARNRELKASLDKANLDARAYAGLALTIAMNPQLKAALAGGGGAAPPIPAGELAAGVQIALAARDRGLSLTPDLLRWLLLRLERKRDDAPANKDRDEAAALADAQLVRSLSQNPQLREALTAKAGAGDPKKIDELWRKLVESDAAVDALEKAGYGRDKLIQGAEFLKEADRARLDGLSAPELALGAQIARALAERNIDASGASVDRIILALQTGLANGGHKWPPIIKLTEAEGYAFDSGKARPNARFEAKIRSDVIASILRAADEYDVDIIEVVGHTDEQPLGLHDSNLDKGLAGAAENLSQVDSLQAADNAGLGMARAAAVVSILSSDERLKKYKILPLSGAQLIKTDETLTHGDAGGDAPARRRIDVRLRKYIPPVSPQAPVETAPPPAPEPTAKPAPRARPAAPRHRPSASVRSREPEPAPGAAAPAREAPEAPPPEKPSYPIGIDPAGR